MCICVCFVFGYWGCTGRGRALYGGRPTGAPPGGFGGGVIVRGQTAPSGPSEVELQKGGSWSNEGKPFRKAVKEDRSKKIIRMTFATCI